ncbi:unnamed protein product [Caenorhabditis sp. 36 PRJEB53466]|nr:unnamed protein product [Caenorhabditis sp. 36 PRJEB53466]
MPRSFSKNEDEEMLEFVAEKVKHYDVRLPLEPMWLQYKKLVVSSRTVESLTNRFRHKLAPRIHAVDEYDVETRVRMLFCTTTPVDEHFLEFLKEVARIVEVDENGCITKYMHDGLDLRAQSDQQISGLETEKRRSSGAPSPYTEEEDANLLKLIVEMASDGQKIVHSRLCAEYRKRFGIARSEASVRNRYHRHLCPNLYQRDDIDTETKLRVMFALSRPVDAVSLSILREHATVTVDRNGVVQSFEVDGSRVTQRAKFNSASETKKGKRRGSLNGVRFSAEEDTDLLEYLVEKVREPREPIYVKALWEEYVASGRTNRSRESVTKRFCVFLRARIVTTEAFDLDTKMAILSVTDSLTDKKFLKYLQEYVELEMDEDGRVVRYSEKERLEENEDEEEEPKRKIQKLEDKSDPILNFNPDDTSLELTC